MVVLERSQWITKICFQANPSSSCCHVLSIDWSCGLCNPWSHALSMAKNCSTLWADNTGTFVVKCVTTQMNSEKRGSFSLGYNIWVDIVRCSCFLTTVQEVVPYLIMERPVVHVYSHLLSLWLSLRWCPIICHPCDGFLPRLHGHHCQRPAAGLWWGPQQT